MGTKAGIKSSEFWFTVIVVLGCLGLLAMDKVKSIHEVVTLASALMGLVGYTVSRGLAKSGKATEIVKPEKAKEKK